MDTIVTFVLRSQSAESVVAKDTLSGYDVMFFAFDRSKEPGSQTFCGMSQDQ
jgi:hypothetical protein